VQEEKDYKSSGDATRWRWGVSDESLCLTIKADKQIAVFVVNQFDRHGNRPGEFTAAFRKALANELADWAGLMSIWRSIPSLLR
jgi:hypothetical protein